MKPKAVIFDLYDTLLYLKNKTNPYFDLLMDIGLTDKERKKAKYVAMTENFFTLDDFVQRLKPGKKINTYPYAQRLSKELDSATLFPETVEVLSTLKEEGVKIGLISNLGSAYVWPLFTLNLNEFFDAKLLSCHVGMIKPQLEIYEKMLYYLDVKPGEAVMLGDKIHNDVIPPKKIGMQAIHIDRPNNDLKEILNYL